MKELLIAIAYSLLITSCNNNNSSTDKVTIQDKSIDTVQKDTVPKSIPINYGDLIFIDVDCGAFCDAIVGVTPSYNVLPMNHIGMKVKYNDEPYIIEASSDGVQLISTGDFINKANSFFTVAKLKPAYTHLIDSAMVFAIRQIGKKYDDAFVLNNDKYYCSELIYEAYKYANNGKPFFELEPMTFKGKNSNEILPEWVDYFRKLNIPVPEGALGCNPGGISLSDKIEILGTLYKPKSIDSLSKK